MSNQITGSHYRFSVLTSRLLRLEYSENGEFLDMGTQLVCNREFPEAVYSVKEIKDSLILETEYLYLTYQTGPFRKGGLKIELKGNLTNYHSVWKYGETDRYEKNLRGTARTLDETGGEIELGEGLLSKNGYAVVDDSDSLPVTKAGKVMPGKKRIDLYFFGYGRAYRECLKDFHRLTGKTPLLPRYALGNWWSRYYPYTQKEYGELFDRFQQEKIPFSVAVLDMDWHLTKVDEAYGTGWTGYTFNEELFPDYKGFLQELHDRGLKVTLNEHPAAGVRPFEKQYQMMAKALGKEKDSRETIEFDVTDEAFMEAYFTCLHHEYEAEGVDFWWIDWQQGDSSKMEGLDPLWVLNDSHFRSIGRDARKRPMIFSRYAGLGSHRYPVGFSGDTHVTWEALRFQPYFTATASNVGFNWWSHDIGGHMMGYKDDELMVRWVQFGVFSPILRLHSTNNSFNSKEPWNYRKEVQGILKHFLRLRHRLLPFLYTKNWEAHHQDTALSEPLYYDWPMEEEAYENRSQYLFGGCMIIAPVLSVLNRRIYRAGTDVWLPEGSWYDFFSGIRYRGGRRLRMYRDLEEIPAFVKSGSIIPLQEEEFTGNGTELPEKIQWNIYAGETGSFELYEDDGESMDYCRGSFVKTKIIQDWEKGQILIDQPVGGTGLLPEKRQHILWIHGIRKTQIKVFVGEKEAVPVSMEYIEGPGLLKIRLPETGYSSIRIELQDEQMKTTDVREKTVRLLCDAQIEYDTKSRLGRIMEKKQETGEKLAELMQACPDQELGEAFAELLTACPEEERYGF